MRRKVATEPVAAVQFESPVGWLGLVASPRGLHEIILAGDQAELAARLEGYDRSLASPACDRFLAAARDALQAYFQGRPAALPLTFDWEGLSEFARAVLAALRSVPAGQVVSYKELARRAGAPGAARAVGRVMADNPFPILVPCHRVLAADGSLGGYSAGKGGATKQTLLAFEGYPSSSRPI